MARGALTTQIKFERFARDCGANEDRKRKGLPLYYDWRVLIDGEFRAVLVREIYGKGYELNDAAYRTIYEASEVTWGYRRPVKIANKAGFEAAIETALRDNLIPTIAELKWLRAYDAATVINKRIDQEAEDRAERIAKAAPQLYEVAQKVAEFLAHQSLDRSGVILFNRTIKALALAGDENWCPMKERV